MFGSSAVISLFHSLFNLIYFRTIHGSKKYKTSKNSLQFVAFIFLSSNGNKKNMFELLFVRTTTYCRICFLSFTVRINGSCHKTNRIYHICDTEWSGTFIFYVYREFNKFYFSYVMFRSVIYFLQSQSST